MVGRNDPCPCGSGKKYKKCCGKEEVVDLQGVIDAELERIRREFAEEVVEPKAYHQLKQRVTEWKSVLSTAFEGEMIEALAFESFFFHDRLDIWHDYLSRKKKSQKRQRVLDVLDLWAEPFFLLAEVEGVEDGVLQLKEKGTGKHHEMPNVGRAERGDWVFGLVMESLQGGKPILQPAQGIIALPKSELPLIKEVAARLDAGVSDSLDLYRPFAETIPDLGLSPFQEEVMAMVIGFIDDYGLRNEAIEGIAFTFLKEVSVKARKPEGVAAGILQAASDFGLFEEVYVPQQIIAEGLDTSVGTLSKYRDMVGDFVMERVDQDSSVQHQQSQVMPNIITDMGMDPRVTERGLWEMVQRTKNANSEEEVNKILQQPNKKHVPITDAERAQLLCYKAFEANGKERERLARKAYELDEKNGDANLLMAEIDAHPVEKKLHYTQAIITGYRNFDNSFESAWGYVLNRPFLRALFTYGAWLMEQGEYEAAIGHLTDLMEKNPDDHQGTKWLLASAYIRTGEWEEAEELLDAYSANGLAGPDFFFNYLFDLRDGIPDAAELKLIRREIKKRNPYLVSLLKESKGPTTFPRRLSLQDGNEDEAKLVYWLINGIKEAESFIG